MPSRKFPPPISNMSDLSIAALREQAEQLGLTGTDIATYVINQQTIAREERAKQRELEK